MIAPRSIKVKFASHCCSCRHSMPVGRRAGYWPTPHIVLCAACACRIHGLTAALARLATRRIPAELFPSADLGFELRGQAQQAAAPAASSAAKDESEKRQGMLILS